MSTKPLFSVVPCDDYESSKLRQKLFEAVMAVDDLNWIKEGMTIAIKTNLVTGAAPEKAIVSHPVVVAALASILIERGARVIVGDSPGGPFYESRMKNIYHLSSMELVEEAGASLNLDLGTTDISFPEATIMKKATITSWLLKADAIISVCKLKTHGMMRYSGNVKNLFGAIPGTMKAEYHYRFPDYNDFSNMLIDLNEYLKPALYITDGIVGMQGNGPTNGTPRHIGLLLASKNPYALDIACARLIGLTPESVPTIKAALDRFPEKCTYQKEDIYGDPDPYVIQDYENVTAQRHVDFTDKYPAFLYPIVNAVLTEKPTVQPSECIGCRKCMDICPAKAITMKNKRPVIDRSSCIRCFCCQEFCPKGAMKVKRSFIARLLQ